MDHRFLLPGEYHVTKKQMSIDTLLGSCVGVCLYNSKNGYAAMNHFLLDRPNDEQTTDIGRYGTTSTDQIISTLMSVDDNPFNYRAQIFGGASVVDALTDSRNIGGRNMLVAQEVLDSYRIRVTKKDVGGTRGRRIKFDTASNTVHCRYTGQTEEAKRLALMRQKIANRKLRVLIVDDSTDNIRLVTEILNRQDEKYEVYSASDGLEAAAQSAAAASGRRCRGLQW